MAAPSQEALTPCPFCEREGERGEIHAHLVADHQKQVETWTDAESGRMHLRVECPVCGDDYEHRVKPRSRDREFLEVFSREIAMVAFDMLLHHHDAEHGQPGPARQDEGEPLPAYGPGGGSKRPGQAGIPLPPGMDESDDTRGGAE